jgi:3-methylcrotonyl-CoA carboxylase alpha subunit
MGLHTNVAFLRRVVNSRAFATADLDTALIEREHDALFNAPPLPLAWAAAGVLAAQLAAEQALAGADPWSQRSGWRLHGGAQRRVDLEVAGERHTVRVQRQHDGGTRLLIGTDSWPLQARALGAGRHDVQLGEQRQTLTVHALGERFGVFAASGSALVTEIDPIAHAADGAAEGGRLTAPMPGKVVAFMVAAGQAVIRGQPVAVMEAMKMEHTLTAPRDGTVAELLYAVGDPVAEGGELLKLAE